MNSVVGSKSSPGGAFLSGVVDETMERGRGRVLGPVEVTVSVLDVVVVGLERLMSITYLI
jgi:hypothetical protein